MVEALFCGTPVITSDWGGFAENNLHGVTGYRCRTMEQFEWAARNIDKINRRTCHDWAINNFSLDRVALMYEEYFETLAKVHNGAGGFYAKNPDRKDLDWMIRYYPTTGLTLSSPSETEVPSQSCDIPEFHPTPSEEKADAESTSLVVSSESSHASSSIPSSIDAILQPSGQEPALSTPESSSHP
jgi:hypothetical protein